MLRDFLTGEACAAPCERERRGRLRAFVLVSVGCVMLVGGGTARVLLRDSGEAPLASAALACDNPEHDFGETEANNISHSFTLTNHSTSAVRIEKIGRFCPCLHLALPTRVLAPGATAELDVQMEINPRRPGELTPFSYHVLVHPASCAEPLVLELRGTYVPPVYRLQPDMLIVAPKAVGDSFCGRADIYLSRRLGVKILDVHSAGDIEFTTTIGPPSLSGDGDYDRVEIEVAGRLRAGRLPRLGAVVVHTTSKETPIVQIPVALRQPATRQVHYYPERLAFGVLPRGAAPSLDVVFCVPEPGRLRFVEARAAGVPVVAVAAPRESAGGNKHVISCTLDGSRADGAVAGEVVVDFADGEDIVRFKIPVSAYLRRDQG